jgi:hypothetical protein
VCFFVLCNRHWFNRVPGAPPRDGLGVTYLPSTISSDAGYADLPLALLGAPVSIGALLEPGSRSPGAEPQDRDWPGRPPGTGPSMYPFGLIGVAPRYIPAGAVSEWAGTRLSCVIRPQKVLQLETVTGPPGTFVKI